MSLLLYFVYVLLVGLAAATKGEVNPVIARMFGTAQCRYSFELAVIFKVIVIAS